MIYGLIGFLIGASLLFILSYILPKGRIKRHNDELDKEEQAQSARIEAIRKSADLEAIRAENLKIKYDADFAVLDEKKNSIKNEIDITKQSAEKMAQSYYNEKIAEAEKLIQKAIDTMEVSLEREASAKQKAHFALIDLLDKEYQELQNLHHILFLDFLRGSLLNQQISGSPQFAQIELVLLYLIHHYASLSFLLEECMIK